MREKIKCTAKGTLIYEQGVYYLLRVIHNRDFNDSEVVQTPLERIKPHLSRCTLWDIEDALEGHKLTLRARKRAIKKYGSFEHIPRLKIETI